MYKYKGRMNSPIARGNKGGLASFLRVLFLASLFLFPAAGGFAAVFNVTDSAGLRNALTTAQSNDQNDTINIAAGTYNTGGTTFIYNPPALENFALTIVGEGVGTTILDGGGSDQVLGITTGFIGDPNADITIRDLAIQNGNNTTNLAGGGLSVFTNSASVTIESCSFSNNSAETGGGARVETASGDITLLNNIFRQLC